MSSTNSASAPGLSAPEVFQLEQEGAFLLDVREHDEWAAGHVAGAVHIPLATLPNEIDRIPLDRSVVCICRSGGRSAQAADWLLQNGRDSWNLVGGMHAWQAAGLEIVDDDGEPGGVA